MDFGNYAILENARHVFELNPDWWWEFRPVTTEDELSMTTFVQRGRKETDEKGEVVIMPHIPQAIAMREVALSFGATNIPKDDKDTPILPVNATVDQVEKVLRKMPQSMFMEIWRALGEAYPFWGPAKKPSEDDGEEKEKQS